MAVFKKMIWLIGVCTVYDILPIKISKMMLTQKQSIKIFLTSNPNISETVTHSIISNTIS